MISRSLQAVLILLIVAIVGVEVLVNTDVFSTQTRPMQVSGPSNPITGMVVGVDGSANPGGQTALALAIMIIGVFMLYRAKLVTIYQTKSKYERFIGVILRMVLGIIVILGGMYINNGLGDVLISAIHIAAGLFLILGFNTRAAAMTSIVLSTRLIYLGTSQWILVFIGFLAAILAWFGAGLPSIDSQTKNKGEDLG